MWLAEASNLVVNAQILVYSLLIINILCMSKNTQMLVLGFLELCGIALDHGRTTIFVRGPHHTFICVSQAQ